MGHLIPAGTGFPAVREIKLVELGEQVGAPLDGRAGSATRAWLTSIQCSRDESRTRVRLSLFQDVDRN